MAAELWDEVGDKTFDHYDFWSFFYGWIVSMQENQSGVTACFTESFAFI